MASLSRACLPLLLVVGVVVVFGPSLHHELVWDDVPLIGENEKLRESLPPVVWAFSTMQGGHWQPLTWLSLWLDLRLGIPSRAVSIALHAIVAVLLYFAIRAMLVARDGRPREDLDWAAFAGAAFFALHPLRVESVVWLTERRDVLSGALLLGAVCLWLRDRRGWAALVHGVSLLAKAWGVMLPAVLLVLGWLLDRWAVARGEQARGMRKRAIELLPFVALALPAAIVAPLAQGGAGVLSSLDDHPPAARAMQAMYGLGWYARVSVVPVDLGPLYERPRKPELTSLRYVASALGVLLLTAALFHWRARAPGLWAAWAVYGLVLAPVLGLVQSGPQEVADRYSYLACLPLTLFVALAVDVRRGRAVAGVILAVLMGVLAARQSLHWENELTLWTRGVAVSPTSSMAHANLAFAYRERGQRLAREGRANEALEAFRQSNHHFGRSKSLAGH